MSELTNNRYDRIVDRSKLLASVSGLTLLASLSLADASHAKGTDQPSVWIDLGGQFVLLADDQERYAPPFLSGLPATLPSPLPAQKPPSSTFDWNGKVTFEPHGADWMFSAGIRYGRSASIGNRIKVLPPTPISAFGAALEAEYVQSRSTDHENHIILDFQVGKDLGIGIFGGTAVLSGGVRIAQFSSDRTTSITAFPSFQYQHSHYRDEGQFRAKQAFHGVGPSITLAASNPIAGNISDGEISVDWGANAALLFGRRKADVHHQTSQCYGLYVRCYGVYTHVGAPKRSQESTIPNLGGYLGLSMRYSNAKIAFGYRADFFFGAMDGGIDTAKSYNRGFYGPYATISIGLGG